MKWRPLSYELIRGDESSTIELPFVLLVLANLSGSESKREPAVEDRRPIRLDVDNFDAVLKITAPCIHFTVANAFDADASRINVSLKFSSLDDFSPDSICEQVGPLKSITEIRQQLEGLLARIEGNRQFDEVLRKSVANKNTVKQLILEIQTVKKSGKGSLKKGSCLESLLSVGNIEGKKEGLWNAFAPLEVLISELEKGSLDITGDLRESIGEHIAQLDQDLSRQLDQILHSAAFKQIEATWRGLHYLITQMDGLDGVYLYILDVSIKELKQEEVDRIDSYLLAEYNMYGGRPYGCIIADHTFGPNRDDIELLRTLGQLSAKYAAPILASVSPSMFYCESWQELPRFKDIRAIFEGPRYDLLHAFQKEPEAAGIALILPGILLRKRYTSESIGIEKFVYEENVAEPDDLLWGNAAYTLATCLCRSFAEYRWPTAIRGIRRGGCVQGLPSERIWSRAGHPRKLGPTQISISDHLRDEIVQLGLTPLVGGRCTKDAVFFQVPTCRRGVFSVSVDTSEGLHFNWITAQWINTLALSRFKQTICCMLRESKFVLLGDEDVCAILEKWLKSYTQGSDPPVRHATISAEDFPSHIICRLTLNYGPMAPELPQHIVLNLADYFPEYTDHPEMEVNR